MDYEKYYPAYIGEKTDTYLRKWAGKPAGQYYASWNWATFFAGYYWMLYRKMYEEFIAFFLIKLLLLFVFAIIGIPGLFLDAVNILLCILANSLYQKKAMAAIDKAKRELVRDNLIDQALRKKGGTDLMPVIIMIIVEIVFSYFVALF